MTTKTQLIASEMLAELQRLTELRPVLEAAERGRAIMTKKTVQLAISLPPEVCGMVRQVAKAAGVAPATVIKVVMAFEVLRHREAVAKAIGAKEAA